MYSANSVQSVIPFLDLVKPHADLAPQLIEIFSEVIGTGKFIGGPMLDNFERDFASFCGTKDAVAVASGTDALRFALIAAGVRPGDAVITVPNTFIATTEAITQAGALPEFVDIDEATYNMSSASLEEYLGCHCLPDSAGRLMSLRSHRPVAAIVPVHLYGQMADMDAIMHLADLYNLKVIEDACQAHGAEYYSTKLSRWMRAGTMGCAAAFSFYPGKNLGACGEGGAITTNNEAIASHARMLRDHGQSQKYHHETEGYNGRMDALQAGILDLKLKQLDQWTSARRARATGYNELLRSIEGVICPIEPTWSHAVYHLYVIRVCERDKLIKHLNNAGIGTGIHYPIPLHLQNAYTSLGHKSGDYPVTERVASEVVSLPMYPQLDQQSLWRVVEQIDHFIGKSIRNRLAEDHLVV
jgi:dTDP-4-amino-4,6-dideoxygalactose transaminase